MNTFAAHPLTLAGAELASRQPDPESVPVHDQGAA
jgi:hypothetical protein